MTRANTYHAIFILNNFHDITMSNDIKIKIDYIPKDRTLCKKCIYYEECPLFYVCPSLDRLMDFEEENGEL